MAGTVRSPRAGGPGSGLTLEGTTKPVNPTTTTGAAVGAASTASKSDHKHARRYWDPHDNGLLGAACDPGLLNTQNTLAAGVLVCILIPMPEGGTIANVVYGLATVATSPTASQCPIGVYNSSGTLIGTTPDQGTNYTGSLTSKTAAVTVVGGQSLVVSAGDYVYVGFLFNGTTGPQLARAGSFNFMVNFGLTSPLRAGSYGSAQTALPAPITIASMTSTSGVWAGVS